MTWLQMLCCAAFSTAGGYLGFLVAREGRKR